jgi:hypothetical protein
LQSLGSTIYSSLLFLSRRSRFSILFTAVSKPSHISLLNISTLLRKKYSDPRFSGILYHAVWEMGADILKEGTVFIFSVDSALKMEAVRFSEMSVTIHHTEQCYISEQCNLKTFSCYCQQKGKFIYVSSQILVLMIAHTSRTYFLPSWYCHAMK